MSAVRRLLQAHRAGGERLRVLSASGQLGYGIVASSLEAGLARRPHFMGCDMGSIDPGPYYLGSGQMAAPLDMVRRDLSLVLQAARQHDIPLIIGSAGTAGARPHLQATVDLVHEMAAELGLRFRLATIASDVPASLMQKALAEGRVRDLDPALTGAPLDLPDAALLSEARMVAQCGTDRFIEALKTGPDVLIAGRACDTAIFAALPQMLGYPAGLSLHMAKIIECTSLCCEPGGRDAMMAHLGPEDFVLESMNPGLHATPASVAAHALYEQADPWQVEEPEGTLDLREARYEALDAHRTRVWGACFVPREKPTLKVEGAVRIGSRAVLLAGVADATLIGRLETVRTEVEAKVRALVPGDWTCQSHAYGLGAVRPLPQDRRSTHEIGWVLEFLADTADRARMLAAVFKQNLLHHGFPGRWSTGGNLAFALTPPELSAGDAYRFVLYHLLEGEDPATLFPIECRAVNPAREPA